MAQIILADLDQALVERLEALARTHGRSLQAELKHILEEAAQSHHLNKIGENAPAKTPEELGWPPGFFEEVAGGWAGEPLVRDERGEYETREQLA